MYKEKKYERVGILLIVAGSILILIASLILSINSPDNRTEGYIDSIYNRDADKIMEYLSSDKYSDFENFFNKILSQELLALQLRSDKIFEYTVNSVNISDDKNSAVVNVSIQYTDLSNVLNTTAVEYAVDKIKSGEMQYSNIESKNESTIQDIMSNIDLLKSTTKQLDFDVELYKHSGTWNIKTDNFENLGNAVTYGLYDSIENPNPQWIELIKAEVSSLDDGLGEILSQDIIDVDINDLLNWYENNSLDYKNLNNKHVRLLAYVKNTGLSLATINYVTYDDVPYISVDGQAMDSFFGSTLTFYNTTDKLQIESLEDGQRVVVLGIARTDGITFEMDHCTLENVDSIEIGNYELNDNDEDTQYKKESIDEMLKTLDSNNTEAVMIYWDEDIEITGKLVTSNREGGYIAIQSDSDTSKQYDNVLNFVLVTVNTDDQWKILENVLNGSIITVRGHVTDVVSEHSYLIEMHNVEVEKLSEQGISNLTGIDLMISELSNNASEASKKYLNKEVEITGRVEYVSDSYDFIKVRSENASNLYDDMLEQGISCSADDEGIKDTIANIRVGDLVTVKGTVTYVDHILGYSMKILSLLKVS